MRKRLLTHLALAGFLPGKNMAFYDGYHAATQVPAHEMLADLIAAEDPPFDGVMGYSQGGSFAISFMIQHMIDHPGEPLPFKFAVFFSPGFCIAPDQDYKHDEIMSFLGQFSQDDADALKATLLTRKTTKKPEEYDAIAKLDPRQKALFFELMKEVQVMFATRDVFHIEERDTPLDTMRPHDSFGKRDFPRFFNAVYTEQRLPIPTVHVYGTQDDPAPRHLAQIAQKLCDPDRVIVVENPGVHEIPHRHPDVDNVAKAIEKAAYLSVVNVW